MRFYSALRGAQVPRKILPSIKSSASAACRIGIIRFYVLRSVIADRNTLVD